MVPAYCVFIHGPDQGEQRVRFILNPPYQYCSLPIVCVVCCEIRYTVSRLISFSRNVQAEGIESRCPSFYTLWSRVSVCSECFQAMFATTCQGPGITKLCIPDKLQSITLTCMTQNVATKLAAAKFASSLPHTIEVD